MSPVNGWKWKWSNGVRKSEMNIIWCISASSNVKACKKLKKELKHLMYFMLSHHKNARMSGVTGHALMPPCSTVVAVEGGFWFRCCRLRCRLWCWFRCRSGWCRFWRRAWTWLHGGVVDLKLVATVPTTHADGHLKMKMSVNSERNLHWRIPSSRQWGQQGQCRQHLLMGVLATPRGPKHWYLNIHVGVPMIVMV